VHDAAQAARGFRGQHVAKIGLGVAAVQDDGLAAAAGQRHVTRKRILLYLGRTQVVEVVEAGLADRDAFVVLEQRCHAGLGGLVEVFRVVGMNAGG
jgi:hypothetical protein